MQIRLYFKMKLYLLDKFPINVWTNLVIDLFKMRGGNPIGEMLNEIAVVWREDMESDGVSRVEVHRVDGGDGAPNSLSTRRQFHVDDLRRGDLSKGGVAVTPNDRILRKGGRGGGALKWERSIGQPAKINHSKFK